MRRLYQILPFVLLYFLFCAKSCNNREEFEENRARAAMDSIKSSFQSGRLSQDQLKAFEETAVLKLNDLQDYLRIQNDTFADPAFREKAGEMIHDLFISDQVILFFCIPGEKEEKPFTLQQLVTSEKRHPAGLLNPAFDSIRVVQPLKLGNDSVYSGKLSFIPYYSTGITEKVHPRWSRHTIEIFVKKQNALFGKDTLLIWKVFLGSM